MTDREFSHPNMGHECRVEQTGREVQLIFVCHTEAKARAFAQGLVRQLVAGGST